VTGFGPSESVRVRWLLGSTWTPVGNITTDEDGSGETQVNVPTTAAAGENKVRADSDTAAAQSRAVNVTIPEPASASLAPTRGTVNSTVSFTLANFTPDSTVTAVWRRPGGSTVDVGSVTAGDDGSATGTLVVPATNGGANTVTFSNGTQSVVTQFEVAPRIKVIPGTVSPGDTVEVSLRGYAKGESVRIRWLVNGSWITVATVTTSNTGSANTSVVVPANAAPGQNSVRGDGTVFRQQTNAVTVDP
jgi:hypothetical protein